MDRLQAMEIFTRVVETHGFKKAAGILSIPPPTVTKTIKDLEAHLGVRLLNRTTRALSLTDAGLRYYNSCTAILRDVESAEAAIVGQAGQIRGAIRVSTTSSLARRFIIPALPQFATLYPNIDIGLLLSDTVSDLVQEGLDCVIRAGEPRPSATLVARRLATFQWLVCASPDYLARHGEPTSLDELQRHRAVGYISGKTGRSTEWLFQVGEQTHAIEMPEQIAVDETEAYVSAGVAGLGMIRSASYMVDALIAEGSLKRVLPNHVAPAEPLSILYPQSRYRSPPLRAFVDWCIQIFDEEARTW
ncbi:LysR family transcriptional regulator [Variovorax sp. N23]|uniref:LysR family transcriptional regulator n=1 Tax=Variovorax sp. N23 TaxID=2980555 RepID=UPI0021C57434|nr:LysR family transcriptional regulator [Variovorax sp. N23]MCU4120233.1 LysR family transcriptional regulator [Variovorax sp. N23]